MGRDAGLPRRLGRASGDVRGFQDKAPEDGSGRGHCIVGWFIHRGLLRRVRELSFAHHGGARLLLWVRYLDRVCSRRRRLIAGASYVRVCMLALRTHPSAPHYACAFITIGRAGRRRVGERAGDHRLHAPRRARGAPVGAGRRRRPCRAGRFGEAPFVVFFPYVLYPVSATNNNLLFGRFFVCALTGTVLGSCLPN